MATSSEENHVLIDQFMAVTGAQRAIAISMLEACAGNLEMAVGMHMDGQGASSSSGGPSFQGGTSYAGPMDAVGHDDDDVRAPIPQRTEVLVEDDGLRANWRMKRPRRAVRSVFDGFRDFQAETRNFEDGVHHGKSSSKKRNLEDLFRPPVDITHKGTFQTARDVGSSSNRWVLVNVQNVQEFECQVLNRDVWSCPMAKKLITDSFIFWQVYNDSVEGNRFMQFYKVQQWPHVAIIDPFTGENQIAWNRIADGKTFCELANDFLSMHPVPNTTCEVDSEPLAKRAKLQQNSLVDASEQDQIEAAIQASLSAADKQKKSPLYVVDSDSEPDFIDDSDDDITQNSDSDSVVESSSPEKPNSNNGSIRKNKHKMSSPRKNSSPSAASTSSPLSLSSLSSSSSSSKCLSKTRETWSYSPRKSSKDVLSKCKNLSTSNKFLSSSPSKQLVNDIINKKPSSVHNNNISSDANGSIGDDSSSGNSSSSSHCTSEIDNHSHNSKTDNGIHADWKCFWGEETDPFSKIMMRFPDGRREQVELPCSSLLKALKVFCSSLGFGEDKYELVTNFPRRSLSKMEDDKILKDISLFPRETVFIQEL